MTSALPGNKQSDYDLTSALDIDYYEVFADIPEGDRDIWQRTRDFVETLPESCIA